MEKHNCILASFLLTSAIPQEAEGRRWATAVVPEDSSEEEPALQEGFPPQATGVGFPPGETVRPVEELAKGFPDIKQVG
jgi:hypothetical protein